MRSHCQYVWNEIVEKTSPARHVVIVAHSAGGYATVSMLNKDAERAETERSLLPRLRGIAFTDSVHGSVQHDHAATSVRVCKLLEFYAIVCALRC